MWQDLELGAPELARLGMDRISIARVALLGALCAYAPPRISQVEPYVVDGQLLVGAMTWLRKVADLLRDPRCVLHSAVTGPDSGEGNSSYTDRLLRPAKTFAAHRPARSGRPGPLTRPSCSCCASSKRHSSNGTSGMAG
jgi:hypothetical protein